MRTQLTKPAFFAAVLGMVAVGWALPLTAQVADGCDRVDGDHAGRGPEALFQGRVVPPLAEQDQGIALSGEPLDGADRPEPGRRHDPHRHQTAYAVLLVPDAKPTSGYKLVVLTKSGSGYAARVLDQADGQTYSGLVISSAAPGKFSDFENTKSVQLKLDSIYLEWIEKGAQLFYWAGTRYHKLQVSD